MASPTHELIAFPEIKVNGITFTQVNTLEIRQSFDTHQTFEFSLLPGMLPDKPDTVRIKTYAEKLVGEAIDIKVKLSDNGGASESQSLLFKGVVTGVKLAKTPTAANVIHVSGVSPMLLLDANRTTRSFSAMTLQSIVSKITSSVGLTSKVSPANNPTIPYITQYEETNYNFLQRLAKTYGEWMYYDGQSFIFGKGGRSSAKDITLQYGLNVFNLDYSLRVGPVNQKAQYYDYQTNKTPEAVASGAAVDGLQEFAQLMLKKSDKLFKDELVELGYQDHQSDSTLKNAVKLAKSERSNNMAVLKGTTPEATLKLGGLIKVNDEQYTDGQSIDYGSFLVTQLVHSLNGNGDYMASFEAIPQDVAFPPVAYSVTSPIAQSQPAVVKKVDDDKSMGRVKVQFAWQKAANETTPWIRVAQPMSSKDQGVYFIPEINEVVFIDFELGNPDLPFVQGSMYHADAKPGPLFNEKNNLKGIITRGGNHILINDESGKESIKIYNKDNKNTLELSLDGTHITIKSEGKINLEAKESISMKAKTIEFTADQEWKVKAGKTQISNDQGMKITAGTDVGVEGTNVKLAGKAGVKIEGATVAVEAQAQATIKANAQLALESSGQASLKGAIVMIN
jgi:type VI secretion system secreted protein VgrG